MDCDVGNWREAVPERCRVQWTLAQRLRSRSSVGSTPRRLRVAPAEGGRLRQHAGVPQVGTEG